MGLNSGVVLIRTSSPLFVVRIVVQTLHNHHKSLEMHRGMIRWAAAAVQSINSNQQIQMAQVV